MDGHYILGANGVICIFLSESRVLANPGYLFIGRDHLAKIPPVALPHSVAHG